MSHRSYDVVIVGGGPGGLAAALALGRARKRVLVCDSGPRRNAAATNIHNFVTRDGTPPSEFRKIGREQLSAYPSVEVRDVRVDSITGARSAFRVVLSSSETVEARRVLLVTGVLDEMLPIDGFRELWGHSIFQCPYCHGYEVRDEAWGYLVVPSRLAHLVPFAVQARAWTKDVVVFANGLAIPDDARATLISANIQIQDAPVVRLVGNGPQLESVVLAGGTSVRCHALFAHPPQRHVDLVRTMNLELDDSGYVKIDPMTRETSMPGVYAAGDLTTPQQSAIFAASAGVQAAAMINVELTMELARTSEL
jgi:thioredoxin reductase